MLHSSCYSTNTTNILATAAVKFFNINGETFTKQRMNFNKGLEVQRFIDDMCGITYVKLLCFQPLCYERKETWNAFTNFNLCLPGVWCCYCCSLLLICDLILLRWHNMKFMLCWQNDIANAKVLIKYKRKIYVRFYVAVSFINLLSTFIIFFLCFLLISFNFLLCNSTWEKLIFWCAFVEK